MERTVLVLGSRRSRDETRSAILHRLPGSLPSLRVTTIHGLAYDVLSRRFRDLGYEEPPRVLSPPEHLARVRELLLDEDPAEWPAYGSMLRLRGFAEEIRQLLLRAQEALLPPHEMAEAAEARGLSGWLEVAAFFRRYLDILGQEGVVDFAGLLQQAAAAAGGRQMFDHLLVDDYQDTTFAAESMLAALAPKSLVVAGDPNGHVFSFQGTTDEPLLRFVERFPSAKEVRLHRCHRRARELVTEAWAAAHSAEQHAAVARELRRTHVRDGVPWGSLAVVVRRQGAELAGVLRALDDAAIPRVVSERGLAATSEAGALPYLLGMSWLAFPQDRDALTETILTSELAGLSPAGARGVVRGARAAGGNASDAVERDDGLTRSEAEALGALRRTLERAAAVSDRSALEAFRLLWRGLPFSARLVERAEDDPEAARNLDAVLALARTIQEAGDQSVEAFLGAFDTGESGPGLALRGIGTRNAVQVLTAHGAVGLEFDTVVVAGALEGNFPSLSRPEPMFDLSALKGHLTRSEQNRRRLEDERRLFRMVVDRARRRVLLTSGDSNDASEHHALRSRFVDELGAVWVPAPAGPFDEPISVAEAVASWRRRLADHDAPAPERLAALDGLLALGEDPSRWWYQRDWTHTDVPLRERVEVSASRLERLENCGLQYLLDYELGLEPRSGHYAWVGHLVHRLIEQAENGQLPRDLSALQAEAKARWRPEQFPSRSISDTFLRLVSEVMLPAWVQDYGSEPARATEQHFEFEFESATVRGYIDRIGGVRGGGSQITDFKTGKKRNGKAGDNLQLGVYYLAVERAEELAPYRPVRGLELVFLREQEWRNGEVGRIATGFTAGSESAYRDEMTDRIRVGIDRIRDLYETDHVRPDPSANCRYCSFRPLCPLYPEGQELFPQHAELRPQGRRP